VHKKTSTGQGARHSEAYSPERLKRGSRAEKRQSEVWGKVADRMAAGMSS